MGKKTAYFTGSIHKYNAFNNKLKCPVTKIAFVIMSLKRFFFLKQEMLQMTTLVPLRELLSERRL